MKTNIEYDNNITNGLKRIAKNLQELTDELLKLINK